MFPRFIEELSEEDQQLKTELEMLVSRLKVKLLRTIALVVN